MYKLAQYKEWPYSFYITFNNKVISEIRLRVILGDDTYLQDTMMWDEKQRTISTSAISGRLC